MARILITDETRQRLQERDPRWRSKCTMRAIATFLDFIGMILFVVSVTMTIHWENVWNEGIGGDWTDGMPLAPVMFPPVSCFIAFDLGAFSTRARLTVVEITRYLFLYSTTPSSSSSSSAIAADASITQAGTLALISSYGPLGTSFPTLFMRRLIVL